MYIGQTITFAEKLLRTHSTRTSWRMRDTSARKKQPDNTCQAPSWLLGVYTYCVPR